MNQRGVGLLLVVVVVATVGVAAVGVAVGFSLLSESGSKPGQIAKLLPDETQVFFSVDLQPGGDQRTNFSDILAVFRRHSSFQPKIDQLFDDGEVETGIHPEKEVLPWLGPEVAVGVVDVVGSVVAGASGGSPLVIVLAGTSDSDTARRILQTWIDYVAREEGLDFQAAEYRGTPVFSEAESAQHYAVTADYVLMTTDRDLLEDTLDRIQSGDTSGSLFENARFKEAQQALPEHRFLMGYVDAEAIWRDAKRQFLGGVLTTEQTQQIDDVIPAWVVLTGAFIDRGLSLALSVATPEGEPQSEPQTLSLAAAGMLPADTLAFASLAFDPDLDPIRKQLAEQRIGDLGLDSAGLFDLPFAPVLDPDATLADALDQVLEIVSDTVGLDVEQDILAWMTGEVALAILPTDFRTITTDPMSEAVDVAALLQFRSDRRDQVVEAMTKITSLLALSMDLPAESVSYGGDEGKVFDLSDVGGTATYDPGYLILGEQLIVATTAERLRSSASLSGNEGESLAKEAEFARLVNGTDGTPGSLIFVNLRQVTEAVVAALDSEDKAHYDEEARPFLDPLRALLAYGDSKTGVNRSVMIITIE